GNGGSDTKVSSVTNDLNGPVSITAGDGDNSVTFNNTTACKALSISTVGLAIIQVLWPTTVGGNLTITTGAGDDNLTVADKLYVAGAGMSNAGGGQEFLQWNSVASKISGGLTIRTGDDADVIDLALLTVLGPTLIDGGTNHDSIRVNDSAFSGTVNLIAGSGSDQILIETNDTGVTSSFSKAFTVSLGSGDDTIQIGLSLDLDDFAAFAGPVSIQGGSDLDRAALLPPAKGGSRSNTFVLDPVFTGVEVKE